MKAAELCTSCGRGRPLAVDMKAKTGQQLTMLSCPRCEARTWLADGVAVPMEEVLKITSGDPEFAQTTDGRKNKRR